LLLSCFKPTANRATAVLAVRRNELVAALADEIWFAHLTPGGQMERMAGTLADRRVSCRALPVLASGR